MLRSLDSTSCDACGEPAVTVLAIGRAGRDDLLRAVCAGHLATTLRGATPVPVGARGGAGRRPP
jgi:hypothetical protein